MTVRTEMIERPPRPGHGEPEALLRSGPVRRVLGALVEGHADVRAEGDLHVDGVFGSEEVAAAVQMRAEAHALIRHLAQLAQTEDLKAAGVGQQRPRPAHKPVQPAHAPYGLVSGPQVEVIGVAQDNFGAQRFQNVLRDGLNRAGGAHRHEDRRLDRAVRQMHLRPPPARRGGCRYVEVESHQTILALGVRE